MLAASLNPALDRGSCPHLAALLKSDDELPGVLASFYALGASRRGWLVHRSIPSEAAQDRAMLTEAGLDVMGLEKEGRFTVAEFDPADTPERSTEPWDKALEEALDLGYSGLWYSRFAIGPDDEMYAMVLPFERAWERTFHGRPVVTLCPYIVGGLPGGAVLERVTALSEIHDAMLVSSGAGGYAMVHREGAG